MCSHAGVAVSDDTAILFVPVNFVRKAGCYDTRSNNSTDVPKEPEQSIH